ncbi:hypothetical protein T492DRAFT_1071449 [Pavlovales sp. CCMP2436]|nr:hypothetical protein T492DRAFT_1071449 [Pavlovales sp. CCMP2436]
MSASAEVRGMILRCAKTGKLFFSEKDAKSHNDDTGFAEFEQVSPDDKVWLCVETGKVCITETEMAIYKKRDPSAKTFEAKTIEFLRERHEAGQAKRAAAAQERAAEGGAEAMDVDGAPAAEDAAPDPPNISRETLDQLLEMGFAQPRCEKALVRTRNAGLEAAVGWLGDHADDADVDEPLELMPNILAQADIDAAAATKSVNAHLSPEEKQAKLTAAVEAAQRKKALSEREDEKVREKDRRESGKTMVKTKAEMDDLARKRDRDSRKKEKDDDLRHREYLRAQLVLDKAERVAKKDKERAAAGLPPLPADVPKPAPTPAPAAPMPKDPAAAAAPRVVCVPALLPVLPVGEATTLMLTNRDFLLEGFVETAAKLADNVLKNPTEDKFRHIKTSNPKVHERLIRPTGGESFLLSLGWRRAGEMLSLPADVGAQAMADAVAALSARYEAEAKAKADKEREKLRVEREASMRARTLEKDRLRAAMLADRKEIQARGPSQSIRAVGLPTNNGGLAVNRLNLEEDPEDNRPA